MKPLLTALLTITFLSTFAQAKTIDMNACLNTAKNWIYQNTSANNSDSASKALFFCSKKGNVDCLNPAKNWIYQNTSANNSLSADKAIKFCAYGDATCLEPTKTWIYQNTSANNSQSAEEAIKVCSAKNSCSPDEEP